MWWLVWMPVKLIARLVFTVLGAVGVSSTALQPSSGPLADIVSTAIHDTATAVTSGAATGSSAAWDQQPSGPTDGDRVIDKIAKMVEGEGKQEGTDIDHMSPEEERTQHEPPRNTKKRMWEEDVGAQRRDEL